MRIDDLIEKLSLELKPTPKLAAQSAVILAFVLASCAVIAGGFLLMRPRVDLLARFQDNNFWLENGISFAVTLLGIALAVVLSRPGQELRVTRLGRSFFLVLGLFFLSAVWQVVGLSETQWVSGLNLAGRECSLIVLAYSMLLGALLIYGLRRGASVNVSLSAMAVGSASIATGVLAISFFCPNDNGMHILLWHIVLPLIAGLSGAHLAGRRFLRW